MIANRTITFAWAVFFFGWCVAACDDGSSDVRGASAAGGSGNARGGDTNQQPGSTVSGSQGGTAASTSTDDPISTGGTPTDTGSSGGTSANPDGKQGTPNLFVTLGGKTEAEVDTKLKEAVNRYFGIGTGESATPARDTGYRCYYELPQDDSMAFIWAADSNDFRSEGMSYGMMIAVQMDLKPQFDKLWTFAKTYMQYPSNTPTTAWKYYFRWKGTVNTSTASNWSVSVNATEVVAPDGDEYFAAALYLADKRWGSSGGVNYKQEADNIAGAMLHNVKSNDGRSPLIHPSQNMVVFVPYGNSNEFTDPSYHLPAFYEMFALYGPSTDSDKWKSLAATSRAFLVASAHATTGLHPDYATFAGAPKAASSGDGHDAFRYDAWRVIMNIGVDYAWFSQDAKMKAQAEKYHSFFGSYLASNNVKQSLFSVDGSNADGGGSTALTATLAAGALASDAANRATYVANLWGVPQQQGTYRYYQESVYLLGLLAVAGRFNYAW